MAVKIRLQRHGRKKAPFYHIVVADARSPRDGRFIEKLGTYNPMTVPATIELDRDKAFDWIQKGAQPTYTARAILRFKGVLYRKHLMRGVSKGALTQEQADDMYAKWIEEKEAKIAARRQKSLEERKERLAAISGTPKKVQTPKPDAAAEKSTLAAPEEQKSFAESVEQTTVESFSGENAEATEAATDTAVEEAPAEETTRAVEETPATEEAPVAEETPAEETAPATEEAPVAEETPAAGPDDLKKIEGIGPKTEEALQAAGINSYSELAATEADRIKEILTAAEGNFGALDPTTWPAQAKMAADGEWDKLKQWQDELDGGKETTETKED